MAKALKQKKGIVASPTEDYLDILKVLCVCMCVCVVSAVSDTVLPSTQSWRRSFWRVWCRRSLIVSMTMLWTPPHAPINESTKLQTLDTMCQCCEHMHCNITILVQMTTFNLVHHHPKLEVDFTVPLTMMN